jgi:hypothetical protein
MTLDPRVSIYLNLAVAALVAVGGYFAADTSFMSTKAGLITTLVIGAVIAAINGILHSIPSKPGATQQFPLGPKVIAFIAVLLTGFLVTGVGPAMAAPKAAPVKSKPAAVSTDPLQKLMDDISAKDAAIVSNVIIAINEADTDAATLTNPSDPASFRDAISHACYPAQVKFLQSLPQVQAIKSPVPYNLIVLFQRKRDLIAQIKAGLPGYLKIGCAALLGDEASIFMQTLGMIGVTVGAGALTGIFPAAAPLTLPALTIPLLGG